jgi:hypothetical protein
MKQGLVGWMMAASVAASVGLAQPGVAAPAVTTFTDATAWQAAISGLKLPKAQTMPAIAPERITMSDAFGSWTKATEGTTVVWYLTEPPLQAWPRARTSIPSAAVSFLGVRSGEGALEIGFGCYTAVFPCLGMRVAELELETPIMGFAGRLTYYFGGAYSSIFSGNLQDNLITHLGGVAGTLLGPDFRDSYAGHYGVLFDRPMTTLRFAWWEDRSLDDAAAFRFDDMVMIGVPEPRLVVSFTLAALLLMVAAGRAPQPTLWRRGRGRR